MLMEDRNASYGHERGPLAAQHDCANGGIFSTASVTRRSYRVFSLLIAFIG
jgi:hypothetical protein